MTALAEIAVFTDDVATASAFYRGLLGDPVSEWPGGTLFAVGGGTLLVTSEQRQGVTGRPTRITSRCRSRISTPCARRSPRTSTRSSSSRTTILGAGPAYLRDPDGRLVELAQA